MLVKLVEETAESRRPCHVPRGFPEILVRDQPPRFLIDFATANARVFSQLDEDLLYVIDSPQELLNTYRFDNRAKQIELVQTISLKEMRAVGGNSSGKNKSKKSSRSRKGKNKP